MQVQKWGSVHDVVANGLQLTNLMGIRVLGAMITLMQADKMGERQDE